MARILIVDDSATDRAVLREALANKGHDISSANDGAEAIEAVQRDRPDLVLLDVVMPGDNGFKVCRKLKKAGGAGGVRVVLVTSKDGESDRFWGMKQGADAYLTKPFATDDLLRTVDQLI
ncbi:MAG: response regulator [Acidobacteriota bacterium]